MAEINLFVGIRAPIENVYAALATLDGLSKWWTTDIKGDAAKGGIIQFRFGGHGPDMEVTELSTNALVRWKCVTHSDSEWVGTQLSFTLNEKGGQVLVRFRHQDWRDASGSLPFCCTKWASYLLGLKEYLETGAGRPFPYDLRITHD